MILFALVTVFAVVVFMLTLTIKEEFEAIAHKNKMDMLEEKDRIYYERLNTQMKLNTQIKGA